MPFIKIFCLIFLYVFLVLNMSTMHLNQNYPSYFLASCFHEIYRQILKVALAVVHFPRATPVTVK